MESGELIVPGNLCGHKAGAVGSVAVAIAKSVNSCLATEVGNKRTAVFLGSHVHFELGMAGIDTGIDHVDMGLGPLLNPVDLLQGKGSLGDPLEVPLVEICVRILGVEINIDNWVIDFDDLILFHGGNASAKNRVDLHHHVLKIALGHLDEHDFDGSQIFVLTFLEESVTFLIGELLTLLILER